jgi:hypothetical protein
MQLLHLVICNWLLHKLEQLKRRAFSSRLQKLFISERMSLKLHFCVNVYELHCNGCYHAIGGIFDLVYYCCCIINSSFEYANILHEHNKASNSNCFIVVQFCVTYGCMHKTPVLFVAFSHSTFDFLGAL